MLNLWYLGHLCSHRTPQLVYPNVSQHKRHIACSCHHMRNLCSRWSCAEMPLHLECHLPLSMCVTVLLSYTHTNTSFRPEPPIECPIAPRKLICVWNPPILRITSFISLSSDTLSLIVIAFHHSGLSNVRIGETLYCLACNVTKSIVECRQDMWLGFRSIIGRNSIDDFPG